MAPLEVLIYTGAPEDVDLHEIRLALERLGHYLEVLVLVNEDGEDEFDEEQEMEKG